MIGVPWEKCLPGQFLDCGCHYTTDDDGIHFCPMHAAAPDLLAACLEIVRLGKSRYHDLGIDRIVEAAIAKAEGRDA